MSAKQAALDAVARLPDSATWDDISERVELLTALQQAEEEAERGKFISLDEFERRVHATLAAR